MNRRIALITVLTTLVFGFFYVVANGEDHEKGGAASIKEESFDNDPHWDGANNRMIADRVAVQDFGYSDTSFARGTQGEIGGEVQRSTLVAYYAKKIQAATLDQSLSASGRFVVTRHNGSAGAFFGWFNSHQEGGGGRAVGSLGMDIGYKSNGGSLAVRLITDQNQSCGIPVDLPSKNVPRGAGALRTGTPYTWKLDYDPKGANGDGQIIFSFQAAADDLSKVKTYSVDLPPNFKKEGATLDRFGLLGAMKSGGTMNIYFTNLTVNGKHENLAEDPHWLGLGNRGSFTEIDQVGIQNFGFSSTNFAGGKAGEIGGAFWRTENPSSYYADRVNSLSLADHLTATGKVSLRVGAPDSAMYIGWFNANPSSSPPKSGDFLGICVEGPTRIGHYFSPVYAMTNGIHGRSSTGPVLVPGKSYEWSLQYDPAGAGGDGVIRVMLGEDSVVLPLKKGAKSAGAHFDHFGLLSANPGGQMVKIFFDDLRYTSAGLTDKNYGKKSNLN